MDSKRHRVIVLCNPSLHTKATAAVLVRSGINVVGIVAAHERVGVKRMLSSIKRTGLLAFLSRALSRLLCRLLNGKHDQEVYDAFYDENDIEASICSAKVLVRLCDRYAEPEVLDWIRDLAPDILVVHSATIVPRSVRELARTGLVVGGHPGLTQFFRGGSSSFRAIYLGRPGEVGWTVFHLDKGVDTGDIISQGRLELEPGDSFETLDWRAMRCIAAEQTRLIDQLDKGIEVPRKPYGRINPNTLYWYPTILEFIRYRFQQRIVR